MYSGALYYQFGIKNLLDAFTQIKDENYQLILCGSGDAEDEIKQLASKDNRIQFKGYLPYDEVLNLQSMATVLVNPRTPEGEYTKYSFPSKTMEYMASGVPVVMYRLPGIPTEYDNYLYYVNGNSVEELKNKLVEVCGMDAIKRKQKGERAQNFVLQEKNYLVQAKKIIDFINTNSPVGEK